MVRHSGRSSQADTNRRSFIKATGASVLGTALAGCGGNDGGDGDGGGGDGNGGDGNDGDGGDGSDGGDATTIRYFSRGAAIRSPAEEQMNAWIDEFEEQNDGITVELEPIEGVTAEQQRYRQMFEEGDLPIMFDIGPHDVGPFATDDHFAPIGDWMDRIDDDAHSQVESWVPRFEETFGPADIGDPNSLCYPVWYSPFSTMVSRRSHYEAAGLDPDEDFPPESYEEFREHAEALDADAPSEFAVAQTGTNVLAIINGYSLWTVGEDAEEGRIFASDWETPYMGNDVWLQETERFVDTFNQDWTSPESLNLGDQEATRLVAQDVLSLTWASIQVVPAARNNAPEPFENDDMMFGVPWSTDDGEPGHIAPYGFWITQQPDGMDDDEYEAKVDAATDLMNFLLSQEKQEEALAQFGQYPCRADVLDNIPDEYGEQHHHAVAARIGEEASYLWPAQHVLALMFGEGPEIGANAMQGSITPQEACDEWMANAEEELSG